MFTRKFSKQIMESSKQIMESSKQIINTLRLSNNLLGRILRICFISSSKPMFKIQSASSMTRHCRFLNKKFGVFYVNQI